MVKINIDVTIYQVMERNGRVVVVDIWNCMGAKNYKHQVAMMCVLLNGVSTDGCWWTSVGK